jgi:hypothetical protein
MKQCGDNLLPSFVAKISPEDKVVPSDACILE